MLLHHVFAAFHCVRPAPDSASAATGPAVNDVGHIAAILLLNGHSDCHWGCGEQHCVRDGTW